MWLARFNQRISPLNQSHRDISLYYLPSKALESRVFLKLINSFDRKLINFLLLLDKPIRFRFRADWPIGNAQEVKINLNSYELINLRKWIHAIFYQHFHCIDSKWHHHLILKSRSQISMDWYVESPVKIKSETSVCNANVKLNTHGDFLHRYSIFLLFMNPL